MISVTVLCFAYLRELFGTRLFTQELPPDATLDDLWTELVNRQPSLAKHRATVVVSVNQEYAPATTRLHDGDEVALLPPVSGGNMDGDCTITEEPLDTAQISRAVARSCDGGVVTFEGIVRDNSDGRSVRFLEYEAYPAMAIARMEAIAADAAQRWPGTRLVMVHRVGRLQIGEASVVVVASSPHRREAFEACQFGIDTLKQTVPIWKKEFFADGTVWKEGVVPPVATT